jgi:methionyl-tRNA formyltransferase
VAEAAEALGLGALQPERPAEALDALRAAGCSAMAVVAYGQLVPRALLDALPWLNLHPSPLPRWRGAAPIERALMAGDSDGAVAVIALVEALDAGPIAGFERFAIGPDDEAGDLYARSLELGVPLLARALGDAAAGRLATVPQVGEPTYARKLGTADRLLDPVAQGIRETHDRVRALAPHIGARLGAPGEVTTIWRTRAAAGEVEPGALAERDGLLLLGCADGALEVVELQAPGRKRMDAASYLRGRR